MSDNKLYKYLGLGVAIFAFVFVVIKSLTLQTYVFNRTIEAFTGDSTDDTKPSALPSVADKTQIAPRVVANTNRLDDQLIVSRYRKNYEDVLIDLDTNMKIAVLHGIMNHAEQISQNPHSEEAQKLITGINNANNFRRTLNDAMGYLKDHP